MPFEQKYSTEIREAATAKALELWKADPKDRTVIRVVSEEFAVGAQSLRGWVTKAAPEREKPARNTRRPKFSAVVTSQADPVEPPQADLPVEVTQPETTPAAKPARADVAALEAEVTALRRGNEALKQAMRVLLEA